MDGAGVDPSDHRFALRSLNQVNRLLGIDRGLGRCLDCFGEVGSVLDLGCGGGGFLTFLSAGGCAHTVKHFVGLDRAQYALQCARSWSPRSIHWVVGDACALPFADGSLDVVSCSLFLHHFDEDQVILILREAARVARRGIIVGDLVRSRSAWLLTWLGTRLLSRSWVVHVDGPRSVRAAYRTGELSDLARAAGLAGAAISRQFPFRLILTWAKQRGAPVQRRTGDHPPRCE